MDDEHTVASSVLLQEEEEEIEDEDMEGEALNLAALMVVGVEESRRLCAERHRPNRLYLTRSELISDPRSVTPWQRLFASRSDRAFITTMGFDVRTFDRILESGFAQMWSSTPIPQGDTQPTGNPRLSARSLDAAGALGLLLHYLNLTMRAVSLHQIFALTPATVSRYINFSMDILLPCLQSMPDARIQWLQGDEFEQNNQHITARHPRLTGAFRTIDGLNIPTATSDDPEVENASFNSWLQKHVTSNVIAFSAEGTIIACRLNGPGSWNDSRMAKGIYEKLRMETPDSYYLVADTAFPRGTDPIKGKIRAPIKSGQALPVERAEREVLLAFNNELTSCRQAAEWGMRQLQGSFG